MKPDKFIDYAAVRSVNPEPTSYEDLGHFIQRYRNTGHIGGVLSHVETDEFGRVYVQSVTVSSILGCGHAVNSVDHIAGICLVCGRLCCVMPGCLAVCDITGKTTCRRHYSVKNGIVVSDLAKKFLWRWKANRLAQSRKRVIIHGRYLPEKR